MVRPFHRVLTLVLPAQDTQELNSIGMAPRLVTCAWSPLIHEMRNSVSGMLRGCAMMSGWIFTARSRYHRRKCEFRDLGVPFLNCIVPKRGAPCQTSIMNAQVHGYLQSSPICQLYIRWLHLCQNDVSRKISMPCRRRLVLPGEAPDTPGDPFYHRPYLNSDSLQPMPMPLLSTSCLWRNVADIHIRCNKSNLHLFIHQRLQAANTYGTW